MDPRRVLVVQHVPWETAGRILPALDAVGVAVETRLLIEEADPDIPSLDDLAGVVIMGGPMDADDVARYPALALERDLARAAADAEVPLLGICLGHQIVSLALGGALTTGATTELGVAPISLVADSPLGAAGTELDVLHWHFDNATVPDGAELLARSPGCPNQAFRLGATFAMQFHLEVDVPLLTRWLAVEAVREEAATEPSALLASLAEADAALSEVATAVFGDFAARAAARASARG
jgi:GMP synthase (glutamine-hydrolysing)